MTEYVSKRFPYTTIMSWEFYKHKHSFWEMVICGDGNGIHYINDTAYPISKGDVIIMKAGSVHDYKILGSDYIHYDFYASINDMRKACDNIEDGYYNKIASGPKPITLKLTDSMLEVVTQKLTTLNSMQQNQQLEKLAEIVYRTLLHYICGIACEKLQAEISSVPSWFNNVIALMFNPENIAAKTTQIAIKSGYSHGHLERMFKSYTGKTLNDYFTQIKLDYAKVLLKNKSQKVLQISSILGFDSLSYFIKLFKRYNGITPNRYRKLIFK